MDDFSINLRDTYFDGITTDFNGDLIRLIAEQCIKSVEESSVYKSQFASQIFPYARRVKIEDKIENLAEDYPEITVTIQRTHRGNTFYNEIKGGKVVATIHRAESPKSSIRQAIFRETLARNSQANLFTANEETPIQIDALLYAQIKYGVARRFPKALSFVQVDFPDRDGNIVESINLTAMPIFRAIPTEFVNVSSVEKIQDTLGINLRFDARNKEKKENVVGDGLHLTLKKKDVKNEDIDNTDTTKDKDE